MVLVKKREKLIILFLFKMRSDRNKILKDPFLVNNRGLWGILSFFVSFVFPKKPLLPVALGNFCKYIVINAQHINMLDCVCSCGVHPTHAHVNKCGVLGDY